MGAHRPGSSPERSGQPERRSEALEGNGLCPPTARSLGRCVASGKRSMTRGRDGETRRDVTSWEERASPSSPLAILLACQPSPAHSPLGDPGLLSLDASGHRKRPAQHIKPAPGRAPPHRRCPSVLTSHLPRAPGCQALSSKVDTVPRAADPPMPRLHACPHPARTGFSTLVLHQK